MLEYLFGSKTRLKLLRTLFRDPGKSYYVRELTRILDVQINAVRRELELLMKAGIINEVQSKDIAKDKPESTKAGAKLRKYYQLDHESILYPELQALLVKGQLMGEQKFIEDIEKKAGDLKLFLLTGRFTGDTRVDTDILLVGNIKERTLSKIVSKHEKDFGFEIRCTLMSTREFEDRRHVMDKFLYSLFEADHVRVVDELNI